MDEVLPTPRWLTAIHAITILCFLIAAVYMGWLACQTRNTTPYERDSEQYNGWIFAEGNKLTDANECEDSDGGWAALGIETSAEFTAGCRAAITAKN